MIPQKRDFKLDLLRIIAISMVVLMHSPRPNSASGLVLSGISYITASGLVLFFMISGALLLDNQLSTRDFLKRRFSKILFPTIFWSLVYLFVKYVDNQSTIADTLLSVFSIPFSAQGHGIMWFMYTLAGLYLLTPILSRWLKSASKLEVECYLLLWGITLLYPYLCLVFKLDESNAGILYYFSGYVGYFVLGYYLRFHYHYRLWHVLAAIAVACLVPVVLYYSSIEYDFYSMLWYLSLPVALMAFCWYVLVNRLPNKTINWISEAAKLSFGVYFIHILVMRYCIWHVEVICSLPGIIQIIAISTVTLLLSFLISWLISKLPFSKYIIGA